MTTDTHLCDWLRSRLEQSPPRRVEPSVSLLQGKPYTNAASTDIRALFERMKQQQQESKQ